MKTILTSALALAAMTSVALATEPLSPQAGPVDLTDAQMDGITAGQLVEIEEVLTFEDTNVAVAIPVAASANVCAVIAACASGTAQRPGRIQQ